MSRIEQLNDDARLNDLLEYSIHAVQKGTGIQAGIPMQLMHSELGISVSLIIMFWNCHQGKLLVMLANYVDVN